MTKLPASSPYEVIPLYDAPNVQPTNNLLATCRLIYFEARNVFVAAQRDFWANNNFLIELRDGWKVAKGTVLEPQAEIAPWRYEPINLMPRVVIAVKKASYDDEYHMVRDPDPDDITFCPDVTVLGDDSDLEIADSLRRAPLEHMAIWAIVQNARCMAMSSQLFRKMKQVVKYENSASRHVRLSTAHHTETPRREKQMMIGVTKAVKSVYMELDKRLKLERHVAIGAVLKFLSATQKVHLKPKHSSK